ncbi:MAG: hypothetical protein J4N31_05520, partial [Chloroflexi bacterium]|nr:hypothetical protein [Chloroflexota bacterium]
WRSDDFGETWTKPNRGKPGPGKVKCVTIDPHDANTIWAGTEPIGLWVSRDACESWTSVDSVWNVPEVAEVDYPVAAVEPHVRDIVIDPKDPATIYLALQVGYMLKSTDGGTTWTLLDKNVDADAHTIVSSSADPSRLFLATGGHSARQAGAPGRALYRSEDGGASWSPMGLEFEQEYSIPMVQHPTKPNVLYSALASGNPGSWRKREDGAQTKMIRSEDGGTTWKALDTPPEIVRNYAEAIALDPVEPDNVFVATRAGELFRSTDGGDSWASLGVKVRDVSDMKAVHV